MFELPFILTASKVVYLCLPERGSRGWCSCFWSCMAGPKWDFQNLALMYELYLLEDEFKIIFTICCSSNLWGWLLFSKDFQTAQKKKYLFQLSICWVSHGCPASCMFYLYLLHGGVMILFLLNRCRIGKLREITKTSQSHRASRSRAGTEIQMHMIDQAHCSVPFGLLTVYQGDTKI